ncbi:MAG: DUF4349 domain-containing protein [Candidatus Hydrogenedentes bacterium]|nr:DUF4349 domain-containing protein [Candidatus Hydrogenedentota bacterium]
MSFRIFTILVIIITLTVGCGSGVMQGASAPAAEMARDSSYLQNQPAAMPAKALGEPSGGQAADQAAGAPGAPGSLGDLATTQPDVYLIKNAIVTVECEDAGKASETLRASLQANNAYVSNLNEFLDSLGRRTITLQVRVPADKFDQSMLSLESLGKVLNKQVSTEDVTEEYVDTESRTRNLKKTEERLLDHLNRAAELEDILRVENELTRVREQIERMDGRLRYLTNRVSFSTISITLQEKAKAEPVIPTQSFSTAREFTSAARSMLGFLQGIWSVVIWFLVWSVVLVPLAFIGYVVLKRLRKQ